MKYYTEIIYEKHPLVSVCICCLAAATIKLKQKKIEFCKLSSSKKKEKSVNYRVSSDCHSQP